VDPSGSVLLELKGTEIDDAVRAGFIDPDNCHYSMFEYAKIRTLTAPVPSRGTASDFDRTFLSSLGIRPE
jgi:hypothetical protein